VKVAEAREAIRSFGALVAVDSVSLAVGTGEVVGLLGANGAGKTTLIRMLLGLLPPTSGEVLLFDRPPSRASRARIGYLPQGLGLYDDLTVRENLAFVQRAFSRSPGSEPGDSGVAAVMDRTVGDLPLGFRRRAAFVMALAHSPELLVLDEPTSGVDPLARAELWGTIREASERGAAVLVSTHYAEEAENCDRLVLMSEGRVVAQGNLTDIIGGRTTVRVVTDDWAAAMGAIESAGMPVGLAGEELRVPGADAATVSSALSSNGLRAELTTGPASFEETFVLLESESARHA
jgi:ABC-2 type transport system ATP-binding protein/ribosome-dependent ATPase